MRRAGFGFSPGSGQVCRLERLFHGVTEAFGAFLRLGGVMIPRSCLRLFVGLSVRFVGQEVWMALWVTEPFWKHFGASFSDPLLWGGILLLRIQEVWVLVQERDGSNGGLVGLHQQFGVMDLEPAQGGRVSGDGSSGELSRGDGGLGVGQGLIGG